MITVNNERKERMAKANEAMAVAVEEGTRTFPKKFANKLKDSDFCQRTEGMDTDELKKKIVQFEQSILEQEVLKEKDSFLQDLKDELKERNDVYQSPIGELTAQIKFCLFVLEGRGVKV